MGYFDDFTVNLKKKRSIDLVEMNLIKIFSKT